MNRQLLAECLTHLQGALKVSALYPEGHPGIQNPLQNVTRGLSTLLEAGHPAAMPFAAAVTCMTVRRWRTG